jgi:hypothetical protein
LGLNILKLGYFLSVRPYKQKLINNIEILNDIVSILLLYQLMSFLAVARQDSKQTLGWSIIITFCLLIGFHISNMSYQAVKLAIDENKKKKVNEKQD